MNNPKIDETFARSWQADILERPPLIAPARQFQYPQQIAGEEEALARGALQVLVHPQQAGNFLANFALGFNDPKMPTGIWTCPDSHALCALAGGYAYVIRTDEPSRCDLVSLRPVVQVFPMPADQLLLFVGLNEMCAWGAAGLAWTTSRLSWEGLRITESTPSVIRGFGWDLFSDREVEFTVDTKTGTHTGGAYKP